MLRLIEKGLMFGNLVKVSTPALVDRYNAALEKMTGQRTGLSEFHIDLSGFSPEIGQELGDDLYLNPNGCNRMFILLVPEQYQAPLLGVHFSASRSILHQFYQQNAKQLFAMTARDAVCGELMNSVYRLDRPADVLSIRTVTVEADTVSGHIGESRKLNGLIERFTNEEDGWWSDLLVAEMIQSASVVGDIAKNPVELSHTSYRQGNFHTTHFGGLYVFHQLKSPAVIRVDPEAAPGEMPVASVIDLADRKGVSDFLKKNRLVETVFEAKGLDAPALLRQRVDFMLVDHLARQGTDVSTLSRAELRRAMRRHLGDLPPEGQALADLVRWAEQGGKRPRLDHRNPAYFYTLRARAHADRDLVNMLLAEMTPKDVRQLFICHKEAFYAAYSTWTDAKRDYVVDFLASDFLRDKQGTWEALYGPPGVAPDPEPEAESAEGDAKGGRAPRRRSRSSEQVVWRREEEERRDRKRADRRRVRGDDDDDDDDDDRDERPRSGPWGIPIRKRRGRGPWGWHD